MGEVTGRVDMGRDDGISGHYLVLVSEPMQNHSVVVMNLHRDQKQRIIPIRTSKSITMCTTGVVEVSVQGNAVVPSVSRRSLPNIR